MSQGQPNYVPANYVPVKRAPEAAGQDHDHAGISSAPNPLLKLHSMLRGRYLLVIVLGLAGAAAGAYVGYSRQKPKYQSVGIIRIKPTMPSGQLLEPDRLMPAFAAFVKSQQALLLSERVITSAMEMTEWQSVRPGLGSAEIIRFRGKLNVIYDGGELIRVSFTDGDPAVAMTGVKCVTTTYVKLFSKSEGSDSTERMAALQEIRTTASNALRAKVTQMADIAGKETDPDSLQQLYVRSLQETTAHKQAWTEARLQLVVAGGSVTAPARDEQPARPTTNPATFTPGMVAESDRVMYQLLAEQKEATHALTAVRRRYGASHNLVADAEQRLATATAEVNERLELFRREAALRPGEALLSPAQLQLQALREKEKNLRILHEESETKTNALGEKIVRINAIKRDVDKIRQDLDDANAAIRQLEVQSTFGGRISAMSSGDEPLEPFEDKRTKLAAAGACGGGAMGVALVLALGFLNRRLVSVHDAGLGMHQVDRMLGVLPHVPSDLADTEEAAVAAHCVHHIRTLLQLEPGLPAHRVYSITSPSPGDGKTTLTIALGMSFASCGAKTLLLDCDIIGGGLSSKMDQMIRPKIGRVLCREGLLTQEQLQTALAAAEQSGRPLGEVLVEHSYVSRADVEHAASVQAQSYVGLIDVLGGEPLADCITGTGRQGLFILPLGSAGAHHVGQLSPSALQSIITEARGKFDVVLIDTGPVLGSLEAAMAAAQSDAVVLTVSRGVPQALVKRSLDRLVEVGGYVVGMVLNRAAAREVADFAFSSGSVRSGASRRLAAPTGARGEQDIRLGSVGNAVAAPAGKGTR